MNLFVFLTFLFIGYTAGEISLDKVPGLNLPLNQESVENAFKDKCKNLTNDDKAFDKVQEARPIFETCLKSFVNITVLKDEVEKAKPTGALDEVFGKYCAKVSKTTDCVKDFYKNVKPCLTETEQESAKVAFEILKSLFEFLCYKDGDRIAMFIAEGGVECFQSKQDEIQTCVKNNFGDNPPTELPSKEKQCSTFSDLQKCVVAELEKCGDPTPANLTEALLKYIKKIAKCP